MPLRAACVDGLRIVAEAADGSKRRTRPQKRQAVSMSLPLDLAQALRRPSAYPFPVDEVGFLQTHTSMLFFAGERVYKVKKAVDLGFLDFTTFERRRFFCEEEVRLNERLAPGVYLGVVPIVRADDGVRVGGPGEPIEVAVEMVRLPAERMLDRLLEAGEIDNARMDALARLLADFHANAATGAGVDEYGEPAAVARNVLENFQETERFIGEPHTVSRELHAFLAARAERFLEQERELLVRRVREGRIRDGHGDLHAGNICVLGERIVAYDSLEFAPRFRCADVACDLAFLCMDLDYRDFRGFSGYLARRYAELARDEELERLLPFYKGYRAVVRAKVASLAAADPSVPAPEQEVRRREAMRYWQLAASYELPAPLLLTCGLPATGKSTAARQLAAPFEALVLRSDVRRKHLAGVAATYRGRHALDQGLYSREMTERTYASLLTDAEEALAGGRAVVVDATFSSAASREPFRALAERVGAPFLVVEVTAPEEEIVRRLERRAREGRDPSDADVAIYRQLRRRYEPPLELPDAQRLSIDSRGVPEEMVSHAVDLLVAQAAAAWGGNPD
jgi:aminoglycoside phosphotransferase family enzyme/predicted kinase